MPFLATIALCATVSCVAKNAIAELSLQTQASVMVETTFTATAAHDDPFNKVQLDAVVTTPSGQKLRVPAFWAGGNKWKVRYASPEVGQHRFETECSDTNDAGLHHIAGSIDIKPYTGDNPLYKHGPLHVAANKRYLEHADGKPFFWLGDTWWMGLCHRLHWPDEVKTLAADRKKKGFSVIQIIAGLYPDMHPFDPRGANEAGFPWEAEYARIRPEYFDAADQRLLYLVDQGFVPCIVGAWGYFMPWMGVEKTEQHWRYLIARYGALPVVWCAAGEANLPWYLAKGFPYDDREQVKNWTEVMRYIRATDPYHRPLTIHPTGIGRLSARHATDDPNLLDFDLLQTPHAGREGVDVTVRTVAESYADTPRIPVIDGEAAYEMLGDSLPTKWTRQMFWLCMTNGAAGHTYGANGIWQCNRPGEPHGPSPHHAPGSVGYGKIPWNEAMNLPGSAQIGYGKKLFEKFAWQDFEPHSDWAVYLNPIESMPLKNRPWLWYPEGHPAVNAPAAKRYFRKRFDVPETNPIPSATFCVSADDRFVAYLNGQRIAEGADWRTPHEVDVKNAIRQGENILAIEAENLPAQTDNPAGLLANLVVQNYVGESYEKLLDGPWRCAKEIDAANGDWTSLEFDDKNWPAAKEIATYPAAPWGEFSAAASYGPYATGISGKVRIIYVPMHRSVKIQHLEPGTKYRVTAFDPQTGKSDEVPFTPRPEDPTTASVPLGTGRYINNKFIEEISATDDWVIVLEKIK